jgi:NADH oxidase (H2O-forming)
MDDIIEIKPEIYWIGAKDPDLRIFDDLYPTDFGTTYNSYLIKGNDRIALIDTVKRRYSEEYLAKVRRLVDPAEVDYIVVNHTEPDHSGSLAALLRHCPKAVVVCSQAARNFLGNLLHTPFPSQVVKDGDVIDLGGKHLRFIIAPFLHWPDTMFTLLEEERTLFTCDAFGAHYSWPNIFADQCPDYTGEIEFYFDCLIRPFKDKVLAAIEKIRGERLDLLCPSHGPVIRTEPWQTIRAYEQWSIPPDNGRKVLIFYLSPHGNTENMAEAVARGAALPGMTVESCHITRHSTEAMRDLMETADALIFGIPTINRDIPRPMWELLANLSTVRLKAGIGGVFGSYGWSGEACRIAEERLKGLNFKLPAPFVRAPFAPRPEALEQCAGLGRAVAEEVLKK